MEISQLKLFWLFFYALCGGVFVGIAYDLTVAVEKLVFSEFYPSNDTDGISVPMWVCRTVGALCGIFKIIRDLLSVILAAVVMILIAYSANSGIMRWMIPAGTAVGLLTYKVTVGKLVKCILKGIVKLLRLILIVPARILIRIVKNILHRIKRTIKKKGEDNGGKKRKRRKG